MLSEAQERDLRVTLSERSFLSSFLPSFLPYLLATKNKVLNNFNDLTMKCPLLDQILLKDSSEEVAMWASIERRDAEDAALEEEGKAASSQPK